MRCGYCNSDEGIKLTNSETSRNPNVMSYIKGNCLCENCKGKFMDPKHIKSSFVYNGEDFIPVVDRKELITLFENPPLDGFMVRIKTLGRKKEYIKGIVNTDGGLYSFSHENLGCYSTNNLVSFLKIFGECKKLVEKYSKRLLLELRPTKKDKVPTPEDYNYILNNRRDWRYIYAVTIL